ncbi:nucleotide-binding protein [Candidatus Woesearchaeota archaeon]|nr:nucleotide-binding protein [Candidatus Woesearchaeota archaeon]
MAETADRAESVKKVLMDTNFFLIPAQFGVDIFSELERICGFNYEAAVLGQSVAELEKLLADKCTSAKDRRAARLGLQLIKAKGVKVIKRKVFKSADKAIFELASAGKNGIVVATLDKKLRDLLRAEGIAVVVLRQKQYLQLQQ